MTSNQNQNKVCYLNNYYIRLDTLNLFHPNYNSNPTNYNQNKISSKLLIVHFGNVFLSYYI